MRDTTKRLRELLDEHGMEWEELPDQQDGDLTITITRWYDGEGGLLTMLISEPYGGTWDFFWLPTPEQAIAATLGPREQPPYDRLIELLAREWGIEASWDGLRRFWHVGWTDERVTAIGELHDELRDAIVEILGERCDWDQEGVAHAHEVIEKAATLGRGTCHMEPVKDYHVAKYVTSWGCVCSNCKTFHEFTHGETWKYCPTCRAEVVDA